MPRIRTTALKQMKQRGERVTVLTAYDYPTAKTADEAGVDAIIVGDSLAMTIQGKEDTLGVTMEMALYHTSLVSRACEHALVIADMPFMSYQISVEEAVRNACRFMSEAGAHAVKLEGGMDRFGAEINAILRAGVPVMGHIGLLPQSVNQTGGYKIQGKDSTAVDALVQQAIALEKAGCFSLVLELTQADAARVVSREVEIPVIGIGSGADCDGQVLVLHDMLGFGRPKRFTKVYADVRGAMLRACEDYVREVREGVFPGEEHTHR